MEALKKLISQCSEDQHWPGLTALPIRMPEKSWSWCCDKLKQILVVSCYSEFKKKKFFEFEGDFDA